MRCHKCKLRALCLPLGKSEALGRAFHSAVVTTGYALEHIRDEAHKRSIEHEVGLLADAATGRANCEPLWEIHFVYNVINSSYLRVDFSFPEWAP